MKYDDMIQNLDVLSSFRSLPADKYREAAAEALNQLRWRNARSEPPVDEGWYLCFFGQTNNTIVCYFTPTNVWMIDGLLACPDQWRPCS